MLKHDVLEDRESRTMPLSDITLKLNSMVTTDVSQTTVRRTLKKQGIKCHAAAVKPFVSETNAAKRVAWCKERLNWKIEDWEKVYNIKRYPKYEVQHTTTLTTQANDGSYQRMFKFKFYVLSTNYVLGSKSV